MNPVEQFMNLVEELDYSGYSLTVFANVLTRVILERNGEVVSSQYLLDDSAAAAAVPASVWVLPSRSAFPKAQLPHDGGAVSADAEAGHTERAPAEASGQEAREREVLIPTVALERWFTVFSDKTETHTSDADLFAEGAEEDGESSSIFWGELLQNTIFMVAASVGPQQRKLTQSVSSSLEPEKLFQFFFAAQFKAIKERVDELASFWVAFGRLAKRIQATRRVRRLSVLTESEREAYTSRGARGVGDDGMGSGVFSASSMDALDDAVYQNEFLTTARVVKAEEETVKSAATEKCGRILNDLSRWFIQYFYASAVAANEPESRNHRILFSPEGMAGLAKGFVRLAVDFDRYPRMPVDELVHYARVRREQFRRLEQLWVAVARGDLAAVVTRKVTLENLLGDSSERESERNDEDEEAHDAEEQESGCGWRSPLTASLTALPEDTSVVPEAILASVGSRGAAQASADRRDWEVAEALDLVAEAQRARAAHAGGHAVEGTSPHTLLEGLRYAAVPEATAFSTALHTVVEQLRSSDESGGCRRHLAASDAIRAELLESLVFPREVLPERSGLADVVPRVTPFSPLKEVALVLECLDARSPCQSALLPRGNERTVEECVNAVPMSRERPCRRRYMGTDLMNGALATGRPEENLLTLLRSGRVLHLEFHNPMPVPVGIAEGYVCDCCGQNHLEMGYQARMYDNVRDDTTFYTACLGYDLCLPCAVYFFKRAFTRLTRALYPRSAPLSSYQGQWRADFYRSFAHGNGGSRVVVWSTVVRPVATAEAGSDASVVEIAMLVSVCPYAAQPVAWCLDKACEAGMVEAFQEHAATAAPESAAYLGITLERRAALPLPPFTWRSQCRVVSCTSDSRGANAAGERAFASDETCPVCLGLLASARPTLRTKCGHWFHVECLGQLPGSEATQGNDAGTVHSGYTDFLSVHETAPAEPAGQTSADADAATDTWEDVDDDVEEEEAEAPVTQASVGAACPMCRCKDYMPSMGVADVLARNTYRLTLQVRRREVVELASRAGRDGTDAPGTSSGCRVALASVISSDGQVHNYTNVASCQQLEVRFPQHFLDAAADGVPAEPVLMAYEEEGTMWQRP